jgi:hypothetical protein
MSIAEHFCVNLLQLCWSLLVVVRQVSCGCLLGVSGKHMEDLKPSKETRTAEQLTAMIQEDLSKVDGCPESGVVVTIYGTPWRAMLMFGAAAGPVRNKAELQKFFEIITERLQRLYDVAGS